MYTFALILVIYSCISVVEYPYNFKHQSIQDDTSSSVWCTANQSTKICHFQNLYFNHKYGFIFLLSNASTFSGLNSYHDLMNIKLSPIDDHSLVNMKLTVALSSSFSRKNIREIAGDHFVIFRFKPDNIFHVIHDDLLPLFKTFEKICLGNITQCAVKYTLVFADTQQVNPFIYWYEALSSGEPYSLSNISDDFTYRFSSITSGVANTSFFQYGFKKPQGPVLTELVGNDIQQFRKYFLKHFKIDIPHFKNCCVVSLVSRRMNRKIINEEFVLEAIFSSEGVIMEEKTSYRFDMTHNSTRDILRAVARSNMLVAIHGAEGILSLFLPDHSVFIELFPFGIIRDNVSPISSLSTAPGIHFTYLSWTNMNEENSICHPEYPSYYGGIYGLPDELVRKIYETKTIPAVKCCNDPFYLFRMYQDTIVDESFWHIAACAVRELNSVKTSEVDVINQWFFPGPVLDLICILYPDLVYIAWIPPFNSIYFTPNYNISILIGAYHYNVVTQETELYLNFNHNNNRKVEVWVSCHVNKKVSTDSHCHCDLYNL